MQADSNISHPNDEVILQELERVRKTLDDSRRFIDTKSNQFFAAVNTTAAIVIAGHVIIFSAEYSGKVYFELIALLWLIYCRVIYLYGRIIKPAPYSGGLMRWDDKNITAWRAIPASNLESQLIAQYQAVCEDMESSMNEKTELLASMRHYVWALLAVVAIEAVMMYNSWLKVAGTP